MNFLKLFALIWVLLMNFDLNAQNFLNGYVITSNGDTIRGTINYKNWEKNPKAISFRTANSAIEETFSINELKEFDITGYDHYLKASVQKDMRPVSFDASEDDINSVALSNIQDTVFLRRLVKGSKISLYELVDSKVHYYVQNGKEEIKELQYRITLRKEQSAYSQLFIFRDQLKAILPEEADAIARKIEHAQYNAKDLQKVVELLNGQNKSETTHISRKSTRWFAGAGVSYNSIDFPAAHLGMDALKTKDHLGYHINGGIDLLSNRNLQNLFVRIGLAYSSYHYKSSGERTEYMFQQQKRYSYDLTINSFTPSISVGYVLLKTEKARPYIAVGLGYNFSSYPTNVYTNENLTLSEKETIQDIFLYEKAWLDVTPRIGILYKKMDFNLSSKLVGSFANFSNWKPKQKMVALTIARLF